ncbi:hypothetical protein CT0861_09861 [Colletotrichum tofieldiae]|uniref:Uncharacterized protein n=1 Tax=Colletotrichum tofieldiae TaxID=708197 RepID=A0A166U358_9PEZI|nr:hypothetical protein CT0861_09861 [Colletotrichum tofieldiae]
MWTGLYPRYHHAVAFHHRLCREISLGGDTTPLNPRQTQTKRKQLTALEKKTCPVGEFAISDRLRLAAASPRFSALFRPRNPGENTHLVRRKLHVPRLITPARLARKDQLDRLSCNLEGRRRRQGS